MIWSALVMALRAIRRNTMRSVLTTLGVVIGVAAVIAMVTLGRGATARVTSDISSLGNNLLIVIPGTDRRSASSSQAAPFRVDDARAIREEVPTAASVAPSAGAGARVVYGNRNWSCGITGSTNDYLRARNWQIDLGREFTEVEQRAAQPVCILGATPRNELFGATVDPIGEHVRIAQLSCEVVGVLASKGRSTFGDDQDDFILMPLLAFQRRVAGNDNVGFISVSATDESSTVETQRAIERLLRQRRRIQDGADDDFVVRDLKEITQVVQTVTGVLTALLGAIAAVSLLVGGIGIMNIMLVSVTERTREIGIRLAIGARSRDVLAQFLVEAVALSTLGGLLGIALGLGGSYAAARALALPFVFAPDVVGGGFLFAATIGVFFGFYPARKAARMNPIDALRHE